MSFNNHYIQNVCFRFNYLHLESSFSCVFDIVSIYEGLEVTMSNALGRFCGDHSSDLPTVATRGNTGTVTFITDYSQTMDGFALAVDFTYGEFRGPWH